MPANESTNETAAEADDEPGELKVGNLRAGWSGLCSRRGVGGVSCCLVSGLDAVLAEQVPKPLHLVAQALDLLGQ